MHIGFPISPLVALCRSSLRRRVAAAFGCVIASVTGAAPGQLDSSFGTGGWILGRQGDIYRTIANSIAVSATGRIAVGATCVRSTDFFMSPCIEVFAPDGSADATTGVAGYIAPNFSAPAGLREARAVLFDLHERIIAIGTCDAPKFCIRRFSRFGVADLQFGVGGLTQFSIGEHFDAPMKSVLQADDKILIGGSCQAFAYSYYTRRFCVARLDANGILDATFGTNGTVIVPVPGLTDSAFAGLSVMPSGHIVVTGACSSPPSANFYPCAMRLKFDGTLDENFGEGGVVRAADVCAVGDGFRPADHVTSLDGTVTLVVPCVPTGDRRFGALRWTPSGQRDTNFGIDGFVLVPAPLTNFSEAFSAYLQPDGKVLIAGGCYPYNGVAFCAARLNTDGSSDSTFGNGGITYLAQPTALTPREWKL